MIMPFPRSVSSHSALAILLIAAACPALGQAPSIDLRESASGAIQIELGGQSMRDHHLEFSPDLLEWEPLLSLRLPSSPF